MNLDAALLDLYRALEAVRSDVHVAATISRMISTLGDAAHPAGASQIGEFGIGDLTYRADLSDRFGRACVYGSRQERDDLELFLGLCGEGAVVWDIGANFGLYAVAAAAKAGTSGKVFAVEPNPRAFALLKDNVERNGAAGTTRLFDCAIAGRDGSAIFYDAEETAFSGLSNTTRSRIARTLTVDVRMLDTLWKEQGALPIDLIKIDVEGHEADVLEGAHEAMAASPDLVVQFEVSAKNLSADRATALIRLLERFKASGMNLWHLDRAADTLRRLDIIDGSFVESADGNVFMTTAGSVREGRLLDLVQRDATRQGLPSTDLERALVHTLALALNHNRKLLHEEMIKNQKLREQLAIRPPPLDENAVRRFSRAGGRRLRPFALADVHGVTTLIRVTDNGQDIAAAAAEAVTFCQGRSTQLIVADVRLHADAPLPPLPGGALLISPALDTDNQADNRYQAAYAAALKGATSSHILILDADGRIEGSGIEAIIDAWRILAAGGHGVAAMALPAIDGNEPPPARFEMTLGGMLAFRHGLVASAALAAIRLPTTAFAGDGFDADLSLELWNAGFEIGMAPGSTVFRTRRPGPRPVHDDSDTVPLERRWRGIFCHPVYPQTFRPAGERLAKP